MLMGVFLKFMANILFIGNIVFENAAAQD